MPISFLADRPEMPPLCWCSVAACIVVAALVALQDTHGITIEELPPGKCRSFFSVLHVTVL